MNDSIFKQMGRIVKNLVTVTKTELQSNINAITPLTLGLGNVNNTSDENKPISVATQQSLNLKADLIHSHNGAYELFDPTILKTANIDVTIQSYNPNTVIDSSYVHTDNNYTTVEKKLVASIHPTTTTIINTTNTPQLIKSYSYYEFRTVKLIIQIVDDVTGEIQVQESMVTTDGMAAYIVNYGILPTGMTGELASVAATYDASTVNVMLTNSTAHQLIVKVSTSTIEP